MFCLGKLHRNILHTLVRLVQNGDTSQQTLSLSATNQNFAAPAISKGGRYKITNKSAEIPQKSAMSKNFQIAAPAISYPSKLLSAISGAGAKSAATLALALHPQLTADKTPSFPPSGDEDKDDADVADYDNKVADYDGGDGLHQQPIRSLAQ